MNRDLREAIKQHLVVGAVVLFALACALWPPADPVDPLADEPAASAPSQAADLSHSDFVSSGGLVPDAAPNDEGTSRTASNPIGDGNTF